jgi:hypothetical protein
MLDPSAVAAGCPMFALVMFLPPILNDGDTLRQITPDAWILVAGFSALISCRIPRARSWFVPSDRHNAQPLLHQPAKTPNPSA